MDGIKNDFDAILEACEFLQNVRFKQEMTKDDVIDSMENRMHILLRRIVQKNVFTFDKTPCWSVTEDSCRVAGASSK